MWNEGIIWESLRYSDPELERSVVKGHSEGMATATNLGNQHTLAGDLPARVSLNLLTEPILVIYNGLVARIDSVLQGKLQLRTGSADKVEIEVENTKLQKEVYEKQAELSKLGSKPEGIELMTTLIQVFIGSLLIILITGAEWRFLARALQVMTSNRAAANQLGLGIALAMPVLSHFGEYVIWKNVKTRLMRRVWRTGLFLLLLLAFIALGYIRQEFQASEDEKHSISVLHFVAVNLFLNLAAALVIEVMIAPDLPKIKADIRTYLVDRQVRRIQNEIKNLNNQISTNNSKLLAALKHKTAMVAYQKALENRISAYYAEALAEYKKIVLLNLKNDGLPQCFADAPATLTFFAPEINI